MEKQEILDDYYKKIKRAYINSILILIPGFLLILLFVVNIFDEGNHFGLRIITAILAIIFGLFFTFYIVYLSTINLKEFKVRFELGEIFELNKNEIVVRNNVITSKQLNMSFQLKNQCKSDNQIELLLTKRKRKNRSDIISLIYFSSDKSFVILNPSEHVNLWRDTN